MPKFSHTTNQFELCSVYVTVSSNEYNIVSVYRPPESSITDFNNTFCNFINDAHIVNKLCVILGDLNIDLLPQILPPCSEYFIIVKLNETYQFKFDINSAVYMLIVVQGLY